ncbi:MAG TPA: sigma-70 family RNA polymerase sigma factor [Acidimicrobiales bacterium]|nr:sigma-70 family RNA polymerase sigma factor [Acidimicrobiales bacterium]
MIEEVFRYEWPRVVASLTRRFGDLDVAEEAAGEAFLAAVAAWGTTSPPNPGGWLMTTATRKAIDRVRREHQRAAKYEQALLLQPDVAPVHAVEDDQLRLIFTCAHPALAPEARLALTLRLVAGLSVGEIARALLSSEAAIGQRITRAKTKIRAAHIPFVVPERLTERLDDVLAVIYLIFNEGYLPSSDAELRIDLSDEAIRLARLLHDLLPDEPETAGLLALLLLIDARRAARIDETGELVTLDEQDRSGWDRALIREGHALVRACVRDNRPGPYQIQAAINAVHTAAREFRDTDWPALATLYNQLYNIQPNPVVALNRAVVTAELDGPEAALAAVDRLPLQDYHALHATRAELLRRVGRSAEAYGAYTKAIELAGNPAEVRHLTRRRGELVTVGDASQRARGGLAAQCEFRCR